MAKVLVVEDDDIYRKVYHTKLQNAGFETEVAEDGEAGISKMKSFKPDIVLMDIMMPKLTGLEALDKIKADASINHIPVVMLTNLSTTDDMQKALDKGAVSYFIKSDVTPGDMVTKVKEILKIS